MNDEIKNPWDAYAAPAEEPKLNPWEVEAAKKPESERGLIADAILSMPSGAAKGVLEITRTAALLDRWYSDRIGEWSLSSKVRQAGNALASKFGALQHTPDGIRWISADAIKQQGGLNPDTGFQTLDKSKAAVEENLYQPERWSGQFSESVTQFAVGMIGPMQGLKALGLLQTGRAALAARGTLEGATSAFSAFEAAEANLFDLLKDHDVASGVVVDYLAGDLADSELEGKLSNAFADGLAGIAFEGLLHGVRALKAAAKARRSHQPVPDEILDDIAADTAADLGDDAAATFNPRVGDDLIEQIDEIKIAKGAPDQPIKARRNEAQVLATIVDDDAALPAVRDAALARLRVLRDEITTIGRKKRSALEIAGNATEQPTDVWTKISDVRITPAAARVPSVAKVYAEALRIEQMGGDPTEILGALRKEILEATTASPGATLGPAVIKPTPPAPGKRLYEYPKLEDGSPVRPSWWSKNHEETPGLLAWLERRLQHGEKVTAASARQARSRLLGRIPEFREAKDRAVFIKTLEADEANLGALQVRLGEVESSIANLLSPVGGNPTHLSEEAEVLYRGLLNQRRALRGGLSTKRKSIAARREKLAELDDAAEGKVDVADESPPDEFIEAELDIELDRRIEAAEAAAGTTSTSGRFRVSQNPGDNTVVLTLADHPKAARMALRPTSTASGGLRWSITDVLVAPEYRSAGLGVEMYDRAARAAVEAGAQLTSDRQMTKDAMRVWESLEKRGHRIYPSPSSVKAEGHPWADVDVDGTLRSTNSDPLFAVVDVAATPVPEASLSGIARRGKLSAKDTNAVADLAKKIRESGSRWAIAAEKIATGEVAGEVGDRVGRVNTGLIDFSTIDGDPKDIVNVFGQTEAALKDVLGETYGGKVSFAQMKRVAEQMKEQFGVAVAFKDTEANGELAAKLLAKQLVLTEAATSLARKAKLLSGGNATAAMRQEFFMELQAYGAVKAHASESLSEVARALALQRTMKQAARTNESEFLDIARQLGFDPESKAIIDRIVQANGDIAAINRIASRPLWQRVTEVWLEVMYSNLLSSPYTHMVNTLSGVGKLGQVFVERPAAAVMAQARMALSKLRGRPVSGNDYVVMQEVNGLARGAVFGFVEAMRLPAGQLVAAVKAASKVEPKQALATFKAEMAGAEWGTVYQTAATGTQFIGNRGVDNPDVRRAISMAVNENPQTFYERAMNGFAHLINATGATIRIPGRAIATADTFFKTVAYQQERYAQAYRLAANSRRGVDTSQAAAAGFDVSLRGAVDDLIDPQTGRWLPHTDLDDQTIKQIEDSASYFAKYQTYQTELEGAIKNAEGLLTRAPWLRVIVPFIKTPTAILTQELGERTPLGLLSARIRKDLITDGAVGDVARTRMLIGTTTVATLITMTDESWLRGGGETGGPNSSRLDGVPPYSIKVGDQWYQFSRLDPIGSIIGLAADLRDLGRIDDDPRYELSEGEKRSLFAAVAVAVTKYTQSKSWLQGISDFFEFASNPDRTIDWYGSSVLGNLMPIIPGGEGKLVEDARLNVFAAGQRAVAGSEDPVAREAFDLLDRVRARLPGKDKLPPRRDYLGRPVTVERVGPLVSAADPTDPLDRELHRLAFGYGMPDKKQMGVKLTPAQYSRYLELRGQTGLDESGKSLEVALRYLVQSPEYLQFSNDEARTKIVKRVVARYSRAAAIKLYETDEKFRERVDALKGFEQFLLSEKLAAMR